MQHTTVLLQETIDGLNLTPNANIIDGTVGGGGHTEAILNATGPNGVVVGFDRDRGALLLASERLKPFGERFVPIHDTYAHLDNHQETVMPYQPFQGIVLDLGLSSLQLDDDERGFAFRFHSPLDMRFDQDQEGTTAADIVNTYGEDEMVRLFKQYGEEPHARRIVRAIVAQRSEEAFTHTDQLAACIEAAAPRRHGQRVHPATRVFQALRIAVNAELDQLIAFLPQAVEWLAPGGRLAIISFHSLEDRIVKRFIKEAARDCVCPPELPECRCDHVATLKQITKKPIRPTEEEVERNPRARSALLRVAERI